MFNIWQYICIYALSVPIFFAVDMLWLGFVARTFYKSQIGHLLSNTVNWPVAIAFYLLFLIGLCVFATVPALEAKSVVRALLYGALFGFFTYATYDLTNWSTLRDWPALVSVVDIAWGTVLSGVVSVGTFFLASYFIVK